MFNIELGKRYKECFRTAVNCNDMLCLLAAIKNSVRIRTLHALGMIFNLYLACMEMGLKIIAVSLQALLGKYL